MVLKKKSLLSRKILENIENNFGVALMSDPRQRAYLESVKIGVHLWPINIWNLRLRRLRQDSHGFHGFARMDVFVRCVQRTIELRQDIVVNQSVKRLLQLSVKICAHPWQIGCTDRLRTATVRTDHCEKT